MEFEWDENKNRANLLKHGVAFEDAIAIFDDRDRLTEAAKHVDGEFRWQTIGTVKSFATLFVVHADRVIEAGQEIVRIISARPASRKERIRYDRRNAKDHTP